MRRTNRVLNRVLTGDMPGSHHAGGAADHTRTDVELLKPRVPKRTTWKEAAIAAGLTVAAAAILGYAFSAFVGKGVPWDHVPEFSLDWDVFRAAIFDVLEGRNPYHPARQQMLFYNPVWTLVPLVPLAFLPRMFGALVLALGSILGVVAVARKLGHGVSGAVLIALSSMNLESMGHANIEFLPWLGLFFPLPVALVFFTIKPQSTFVLILLLLYREYQQRGWKAVAKATAPVVILAGVTLLIYGLPPQPAGASFDRFWAIKAVVAGIPAMALAFKRDDLSLAAAAGPLLAPYAVFHSYLAVLFPFKKGWILLPLVVLSYVVWLLVIS